MHRHLQILLPLLLLWVCSSGQDGLGVEPFQLSGTVPLAQTINDTTGVLDRGWKYSFGQEPAAKLLTKNARELSASAQFNYLSTVLSGRLDTRGIITYRVTLKTEGTRCTYIIDQFVHRGNTTTRTGGIHFGRLMKGAKPSRKVRNLSGKNVERIHADMKTQVELHLNQVLAALALQLQLAP